MDKNKIFIGLLKVVSFSLLSFLFYEMIKPLPQITNTNRIDGFIIFSVIILGIYQIFKSKILAVFLNFFSIIFVLLYLFKKELESYSHFIERLLKIIKLNLSFVWQGKWESLTAEFNTIIFLILLSAIIIFMAYLIKKRKGFLLVIFVVSYFSIIDTYFNYDAKWAIFRVLIAGLIFIGIEKQKEILVQTNNNGKTISIYFLSAILISSLLIATPGLLLPKIDASWFKLPEVLSFMQGDEIIVQKQGFKKTGYGDDDTELGGPLKSDNTIIMETVSTKRVYWRGESKDEYTGRGWVNSEESIKLENVSALKIDGSENIDFPNHLIKDDADIEMKELEQRVFFPNTTYYHFFYAGDFEKVIVDDLPTLKTAYSNSYSNLLYTENKLNGYYIKSSIPVLDLNILKDPNLNNLSSEEKILLAPYLQLPKNLPNRVVTLSLDITKDYDNSYDKVLAIRNYLRSNYAYDLNAPHLDEGDDFVDNFLFETKVGYCDHFSTSMVILARSAGIPARWVKGFAPGELTYKDEQFIGTVRSSDAHSWVEVYFPEIGWVSFDPTPGFNFTQDLILNDNQENINETTDANDENEETVSQEDENQEQQGNRFTISFGKILKYFGLVVLISVFTAFILIYQYRLEVTLWLNQKRLGKVNSISKMIILVTEKMLDILKKRYGKRAESQTVREYLETLNSGEKDDFKEVIDVFEQARYSSNQIPNNWRNKIWDVWKRIIK